MKEGIKVHSDQKETVTLKPGQQVQLNDNGMQLMKNPDIETVLAWKNGLFSFKGADLGTIMREVSRTYDVDIVYSEPINEKFFAEVPRNTNVSSLLKMLEITKAVKFKIEGKK